MILIRCYYLVSINTTCFMDCYVHNKKKGTTFTAQSTTQTYTQKTLLPLTLSLSLSLLHSHTHTAHPFRYLFFFCVPPLSPFLSSSNFFASPKNLVHVQLLSLGKVQEKIKNLTKAYLRIIAFQNCKNSTMRSCKCGWV